MAFVPLWLNTGRVRRLAGRLAALLLFAGLACLWSYPLVTQLSTAIPGEFAGDNLAFLWNTWWARQVAAGFPSGFFFSPLLFAPVGFDLTLHTHTALHGFVSARLLGGLSTVAAQNVIILGSLTLNGFFAFLLARDRTHDTAGAIVAGIVFGGCPFVAAHLLGHFNLINVWTLPAFLLCAFRALERRSWVWSSLAGATLVATAYSDYYLLVYVGVLGLGVLFWGSGLLRWRWRPAPLSRRAATWIGGTAATALGVSIWIRVTGGSDFSVAGMDVRASEPINAETAAWALCLLAAWLRTRPTVSVHVDEARPILLERLRLAAPALLVAVVGMLPLELGAVRLWTSGDYTAPPQFWRSGPSGIDVATLVLGNPMHPISGAWTSGMYQRWAIDRVESSGWLGVVPLIVVLTAVARARTDARLRPLLAAGGLFFVWALGGWLTVAGARTGVLLPANLIGYVPILSNARIPARAIVVTSLMIALLAARLIAALPPARRRMLAMVAGTLVLIDYLPAPYPTIGVETPALYETLAQQPEGAVLELPVGLRDGFEQIGLFDDRTLLHQMAHRHALVGGFAARIPPSTKDLYRDMPIVRSLLLLSEPGGDRADARDEALSRTAAGEALVSQGVCYIVVDRSRASAQLLAFIETALPLSRVAGDDTRELFVIATE